MKLYTEHMEQRSTDEGIVMEPDYAGFLRSQNYAVNGLTDIHTVHSESDDRAYLVAKIETLALPNHHPELDLVANQIELPVCSCDDWRYNQSVDISESGVHPPACGTCKHIRSAYKEERAKADNQQVELV